MDIPQKRALSILISMSVLLILAIGAVAMRHVFQMRWPSMLVVALVTVVACAGGVLFFRLRPNRGGVLFDERDREIQRNASLSAVGSVLSLLMLGSFAAVFIFGEKASLPVASLPLIVTGVGVLYAYAFFISLMVQYGSTNKREEWS